MIITKDSHLDHNLGHHIVRWIDANYCDRDSFFIEEVEIPYGEELPCNLHGPIVGEPPVTEDEVRYEVRGNRSNHSRICDRPPALTRRMVIVAGPHEDEPCVLYTAYPGPLAPREPGDPDLEGDDEALAEAEKFWAEHALNL